MKARLIPGGEVKTQMMRNNNIMNKIDYSFGLWLVSLIFVIVLSTSAAPSHAQVGADNKLCPAVAIPEGMLVLDITPDTESAANFSGALIGSIDRADGIYSGGLDWMQIVAEDDADGKSASTNKTGSQLISWWSRRYPRSTKIQVTNASSEESINLHVQIFDNNCLEALDFYDTFEPLDTHVYNLNDIFTNNGGTRISTSSLVGMEGAIVVTAVDSSSTPGHAVDFNFLSGNAYISDSIGYAYGVNMQARRAICKEPECEEGRLSGEENSKLEDITTLKAFGMFNALGPTSRSDVVLINISDHYGPPYLASAVSSDYEVSIVDSNEVITSCGETSACFLNLGIDDRLPLRQAPGSPDAPFWAP